MLFGVQQGSFEPGPVGTGWETVRAVALVGDEGGFDSFWIPDHVQFGVDAYGYDFETAADRSRLTVLPLQHARRPRD